MPKSKTLSISSMQDNKSTNLLANMLSSQQKAVIPEVKVPPPTVAKQMENKPEKKLLGFRVPRSTARAIEKMCFEEDLTLQAFILMTINAYRVSKGLGELPS